MRLETIRDIAVKFGVSVANYAIPCRIRYLQQQQAALSKSLEEYLAFDGLDATSLAVANQLYLEEMDKFLAISKEIHFLALATKRKPRIKEDDITQDMIDRARSTPVETIIEFKRGKARCIAPDHNDKNPSMFHGTRTNTAQCPVCGRSFDAIACYRHVWGVSFVEAVRRLQ